MPLLAHVPGSLADRAGGRHCGIPGDAPSWVTHHSISSRAALLPGVWHQDVQLARHGNCFCANACLNNDIFKLMPAEMFAFCSHAPQEHFLLIDLTAWDFPKILNGFMALLPGGVVFPLNRLQCRVMCHLFFLRSQAFWALEIQMLVFLLSSFGILFLLSSLGNEMKPICKKIYCRHCCLQLSGNSQFLLLLLA